jgi:alpha-D-xyloside xylohydrolase
MRLRYRLMPYLYSLAAAVHYDDYTIMRALPMDWPADPQARDLDDQWMFGPALMPCPVSEYGARSRGVYFPEGGWYDFYSGAWISGSRSLTVDAPYERMPLYVRAGSIIPFGPEMQWSDEKPADVIRLYVYAGADAEFTLYEDDGLTFAYEEGAFARIPIRWDDATRTLTVGAREGSFPGMLQQRRFVVVVVDPAHPHAYDPDAEGLVLDYLGETINQTL